jgi:hypothetical protein
MLAATGLARHDALKLHPEAWQRQVWFRDPLNQERRCIPLRHDDDLIKGGAHNSTAASPAALDLGWNASIYEAERTVVRYGL